MTDKQDGENRPAATHRDGSLEVAIWRRDTDKGPVFNTERTRSYQDPDGNWRKTHAIPERELLRAARLDQKAYESILKLREQARSGRLERKPDRRERNDRER